MSSGTKPVGRNEIARTEPVPSSHVATVSANSLPRLLLQRDPVPKDRAVRLHALNSLHQDRLERRTPLPFWER
jgi:hypothetical protein